MPTGTDPSRTFKVVLKCDEKKANPPTFIYQLSTCREIREFKEYYQKLMAAKTDKQIEALGQKRLFQLLTKKLVGWKNMVDPISENPIKFDRNELDTLVNTAEAFELLFRIIGQGLSDDDKKKLKSRSGTNSGRSAKGAKGRKRVKTSRMKPSRS
jgi:hypothetical protein